MKIKISATFEGKCMICKHEGTVFSAGDEDTKKMVTVCHECANELGDTPTSEVIEKYGFCDKSAFVGSGIEVQGLEKVQARLKEIQRKGMTSGGKRKRKPKDDVAGAKEAVVDASGSTAG